MKPSSLRWLLTNGLGGLGMGNATGVPRDIHDALLTAVIRPPLQRRVIVRHLYERVAAQGKWITLGDRAGPWTFDYDPRQRIPVYRYALDPLELEKIIWMNNREPAVYIRYACRGQAGELRLQVCPAVPLSPDADRRLYPDSLEWLGEQGFVFDLEKDAKQRLYCSFDQTARREAVNQWRRIALDSPDGDVQEWLYLPAALETRLRPGEQVTLRLGLDNPAFFDGAEKWQQTAAQQRMIVERLPEPFRDGLLATLALSGEQFIVERATRISRHSLTLLSGYPDQTDDGWSTLIALPAVLLSMNYLEKARRVLSMLKEHARPGVLPGRFPAEPGDPDDSRLDAGLWYFNAVYEFWLASGDRQFLQQEYPFLIQLLNAYMNGTEHGVKMDEEDGLLENTRDSVARTWMHQRLGHWEATPRIGKAVEVQALWYNAVKILNEISAALGNEAGVQKAATLATTIEASIRSKFWLDGAGYLADVVHGQQVDTTLRANQILAAGLPHSPLTESQTQQMLAVVDRHLLTHYGLRTLSPEHPAYCGHAGPAGRELASAWHNGAVHPWLAWPYLRAALRAGKPPRLLLQQFTPLFEAVQEDVFGHLPEAFEGDPPHRPLGAPASLLSLAAAFQSYWILTGLEQGD